MKVFASITPHLSVGDRCRPVFFAGPCVIESRAHALKMAKAIKKVFTDAGVADRLVYKSSFDKANRSAGASFRGPGIEKGLAILSEVKEKTDLPILTDVHEPEHCALVAEVADVLQIPAFLCRQTDLILAAAATKKAVNVKKGQFLAPDDCKQIVDKCHAAGNTNVMLTERGATFGYHNLVVDFRGLPMMRSLGVPVDLRRHALPPAPGRPRHRDGRLPRVRARPRAGRGVGRRRRLLLRGPRRPGAREVRQGHAAPARDPPEVPVGPPEVRRAPARDEPLKPSARRFSFPVP